MSSFVETETSEAEVSVASMTAHPPTVTLVHEGKDGNNVRRSFVQQVPVRAVNLASRALSDLRPGDRIRAVVVNEWHEDGCETYLTDYTKVQDAEKVRSAELEAVISSEAVTFVRNDITQIAGSLAPASKTKVPR